MREIKSPSLASRTTIRLGGCAETEFVLDSLTDIERLPQYLGTDWDRVFCIGKGSNLLAKDGKIPLVLLRSAIDDGIRIIGRREGQILLGVSAATPLRDLLRYCLKNGLSGLEGLVGIPGSVGGACAMNAGSFGSETACALDSLTYFDGKDLREIKKSEFEYGYRFLKLPAKVASPLIVEAIFTLTQCKIDVIFKRMSLNFLEKKSRQPLDALSAGCAFKNPPAGPAAGKLLDDAGLKGKVLGGMAFSDKHANFLINTGNGSATAALDLLALAEEKVLAEFDIRLEKELRLLA